MTDETPGSKPAEAPDADRTDAATRADVSKAASDILRRLGAPAVEAPAAPAEATPAPVAAPPSPVQPAAAAPAPAVEAKTASAPLRSPKEKLEPGEVPPPPKGRRRSKAARSSVVVFLNGIMSFLVLCALAAVAAVYFGKHEFEAPGPLGADRVVEVPQNAGLQQVSGILERQGVVASSTIFGLGVQAYGAQSKIKAGEFEFKAGMSMREVMDTLVDGKALQYSLTVPEGWSVEQIIRKVQQDEVLRGTVTVVPQEGSLLPETYKFTRGTTRDQLIERMRQSQERLLQQVWARRASDLPIRTPRDLVTLASIVEKETGKVDERTRVAGVFVNRLRKGMRLQSDPTILYGLYGGKAWMEARTILRSELQAPNPYNTYQIDGLPPGPIANPGRAALEAVANPSRTDDLFFVADGTGGHIFAVTYEEHQRNVARWRQIERERRQPEGPVQTDGRNAPIGTPAAGTPPAGTRPAAPGTPPPRAGQTTGTTPPGTQPARPPAAGQPAPAAGTQPPARVN